jgi:hypothetical protein
MNSSTSGFNQFRKQAFWFCLILLILYATVESFSRALLNRAFQGSQSYSQSLRFLEYRAPEIDVLFLGDSEIYYGIDPRQIEFPMGIHNFAFPAEGIIATYHKLKHYVESGALPKLHTLFLQCQPHSFDPEKRFRLRGYGDFSAFLSHGDLLTIYGGREWMIQCLYQSHFLKFRKHRQRS